MAYALVTVDGGETVDNENSAYALASCDGCTTLAASFQVVLVIGQSDRITPINIAEALNVNCPRCITTAIAKQLVISLRAAPPEDLLRRLTEELRRLDAIDTGDSPADILNEINSISDRGVEARRRGPGAPAIAAFEVGGQGLTGPGAASGRRRERSSIRPDSL